MYKGLKFNVIAFITSIVVSTLLLAGCIVSYSAIYGNIDKEMNLDYLGERINIMMDNFSEKEAALYRKLKNASVAAYGIERLPSPDFEGGEVRTEDACGFMASYNDNAIDGRMCMLSGDGVFINQAGEEDI